MAERNGFTFYIIEARPKGYPEGFVLRLRDDYNVSFKVKNPNYSI